jgi:hypothetical protein
MDAHYVNGRFTLSKEERKYATKVRDLVPKRNCAKGGRLEPYIGRQNSPQKEAGNFKYKLMFRIILCLVIHFVRKNT